MKKQQVIFIAHSSRAESNQKNLTQGLTYFLNKIFFFQVQF